MEHNGKSHQLLELRREFLPHQITAIANGFDHSGEHKIRKHLHKKDKPKKHHMHGQNQAAAILENCEFQFETVDELEDGKNEDISEENDAGLFHVHLIEAEGLPQMDMRGLTDAYVHAHLISHSKHHSKRIHLLHHTARHKSITVEDDLNPTFDEAWTFQLHKDTTHVHFKIIDADPIGKDDPIGEVVISMEDYQNRDDPAAEWDEWFDIQPVKKGPKLVAGRALKEHPLGRIRFCFEWCSPLDATEKLVEWSRKDQEAGRIKKKRKVWRFRAMCPEHKYAWIHALNWLSEGCVGPRPGRLPAPPLHKDDVRIAINNVALIDLPFVRLRHLLYNLWRFNCFKCKKTREFELYTLFQLELHAYKAQATRSSSHVVVHRSGLSAQTGLTLSHIRGLNFHLVMQRLALLQYGKPNSLPYSQQMAEYEMEKNAIALHVIQACLSYWVMVHHARKADGRLPEAAYWRRTTKDIEIAKRESERLKEALKEEKMSVLRKKATEYGVPQRDMDRIDDVSENPHDELLELVLEYYGRMDAKTNTGRTKTAFYIGAMGARNLRLQTLLRLKTIIKKNDPLVVYGDPEENLQEKLYALAHPDEFVDDPMAPTEGPSCMNRRKLKQLERKAEQMAEDAAHLADSIESRVENVANIVGDTVEKVSDAVENTAIVQGSIAAVEAAAEAAESAAMGVAAAAIDVVTEEDGAEFQKAQGSPKSRSPKSPRGVSLHRHNSDSPKTPIPEQPDDAGDTFSAQISMEREDVKLSSKERKQLDKDIKKGKKNKNKKNRETEFGDTKKNRETEFGDTEFDNPLADEAAAAAVAESQPAGSAAATTEETTAAATEEPAATTQED